jgi:acetyl esterase/lipase
MRGKRMALIAALGMAVAGAAPVQASAGDLGGPGGEVENIAYGTLPDQTLDLCRPADRAARLPAVVIFHGGGWSGGDKSRFAGACRHFAAAGIVAVAANYRLAAGVPGTVWPVQFQDAEAALGWVSAHAAALGVDPARICALGHSAGGQLALLAGLPKAVARYGGGPALACSISVSGPTDLAALSATRRPMVSNLTGGQAGGAQAASPIFYVARQSAPALLIHGTADPVIPFEEALSYDSALTLAQVPVWLVRYDGGHVLQGTSAAQREHAFALEVRFIQTLALGTPPGQSDLR